MTVAAALTLTHDVGPVRHLVMNRPEARNALSNELKVAMVEEIERFEADPAARVMILSGCDCGSFSSGGDLRRVLSRLEAGLPITDPEAPDLFARFTARRKPVIAAIDGHALGGGFELALASDIRVATVASTFGMPEPRAGLLGQYGLDHLSRLVPLGEALKLQLTGAPIDADRAYAIGLVQELAADRASMFAAAQTLADAIVACSPTAVRTIRHVVRVGRDLPAYQAEQFSQPFRDAVHNSADALAGTRAALDKTVPRWDDGG